MISGTLSQDDYLAAQRLHRKAYLRRQLVILVASAVVGLIVACTGHFLVGIVLVGAGAGGLIGEWVLSKFSLPRRHVRIFHQQASLRSNFTYSWDSECICVVAESGQAKRLWRDYVKSKEDDRVFLLYHSDVMFEIFPKAWFSCREQVEEFRLLATQVRA